MTFPDGAAPIDRSSPVPLYFQLAQYLERAIDAGDVGRDGRLDNELQLATQLGLSRPTVRRAIQYLVEKGLLVRKRGVGTTVVHEKVRRGVELTSLYDDLLRSGQRPTTRVLHNHVVPAPHAAAHALGLADGAPVVTVERIRYARDEPIALLRNYLPVTVAAPSTPLLQQHGLYELMRGSGIVLRAAVQSIGARTATPAEARLLGEARRAPLLTMERTVYDEHGDAIEYGNHIYRASRYCFEQSLVAR